MPPGIAASGPPQSERPEAAARMPKALVVTTRESLLPAVLRALAGADLVTDVARDAAAAGRRLARERIDLLVVDFATLPPGEVAALLAARGDAPGPPLVAVVPARGGPALRRAAAFHAEATLVDPFDLAAAAATLARLLREREAAQRDADPLEGLSTFLRGLAHEILNPLTPITAFLQILQREPSLTPELKSRYDRMLEGTRRIEKTVRDLECFARVRKPQRALFDLARFLREQLARWRDSDAALAATLDAPEETPLVLGDRDQLASAFLQLARFASAGGKGRVDLALRTEGRELAITLTGHEAVRLPPRPADALLPYHDIQGAGRPGTLELAAAWGVLRGHRGRLEVEPQPGGAVRFQVALPVARVAGEDDDEGD